MKVLTREEFSDHWNNIQSGLGDSDSALWSLEQRDEIMCRYFILTDSPIFDRKNYNDGEDFWGNFWNWCRQYLQGSVYCYSSNQRGEWWGFTDRDDIVLWSLRWL